MSKHLCNQHHSREDVVVIHETVYIGDHQWDKDCPLCKAWNEVAELRAEVERLTLKPHERVIDTRKAEELMKRLAPVWSFEAFQELKKELGL